jgi:hypothetical protein
MAGLEALRAQFQTIKDPIKIGPVALDAIKRNISAAEILDAAAGLPPEHRKIVEEAVNSQRLNFGQVTCKIRNGDGGLVQVQCVVTRDTLSVTTLEAKQPCGEEELNHLFKQMLGQALKVLKAHTPDDSTIDRLIASKAIAEKRELFVASMGKKGQSISIPLPAVLE